MILGIMLLIIMLIVVILGVASYIVMLSAVCIHKNIY
jgi:hypothetical protein